MLVDQANRFSEPAKGTILLGRVRPCTEQWVQGVNFMSMYHSRAITVRASLAFLLALVAAAAQSQSAPDANTAFDFSSAAFCSGDGTNPSIVTVPGPRAEAMKGFSSEKLIEMLAVEDVDTAWDSLMSSDYLTVDVVVDELMARNDSTTIRLLIQKSNDGTPVKTTNRWQTGRYRFPEQEDQILPPLLVRHKVRFILTRLLKYDGYRTVIGLLTDEYDGVIDTTAAELRYRDMVAAITQH